MLGGEGVAGQVGEEVAGLSCFPLPAAEGWDVIPAPGKYPQEQEYSWLSSGMVPIRCGWHHPALTYCSEVTFLLDSYQVRSVL